MLASIGLLLALTCQSALAREGPAGRYRIAEGPDVASELVLQPDGRFEYMLIAGALDQYSRGRWTVSGPDVKLFTEPKPNPPVFSVGPASRTEESALSILVSWPDGRGIASIDVKIGFATGDPIEGYTQEYGWSLPVSEARKPLWVELSQSMYNLVSPKFPVDVSKANALNFKLTPNDLGMVDFQGARVELVGDRLLLHLDGGVLKYVRMKD